MDTIFNSHSTQGLDREMSLGKHLTSRLSIRKWIGDEVFLDEERSTEIPCNAIEYLLECGCKYITMNCFHTTGTWETVLDARGIQVDCLNAKLMNIGGLKNITINCDICECAIGRGFTQCENVCIIANVIKFFGPMFTHCWRDVKEKKIRFHCMNGKIICNGSFFNGRRLDDIYEWLDVRRNFKDDMLIINDNLVVYPKDDPWESPHKEIAQYKTHAMKSLY